MSLFVVIGMLSLHKRRKTGADYLLASQDVQPWLVALSAVATNNSGYMFIGMIGFTYTYGLSSIWLMIGWITGRLPRLVVGAQEAANRDGEIQHAQLRRFADLRRRQTCRFCAGA